MTINIVAGYRSIQNWFIFYSHSIICCVCQEACSVQNALLCYPPMLVFCIAGAHLQIEHNLMLNVCNSNSQSYSLVGIIYFGQDYFISRIILPDHTVWIHDGIIGCQSAFDVILGKDIDMSYCRGKIASYAVYTLDI
jgi:hypothetical protein